MTAPDGNRNGGADALALRDLRKRFGATQALDGASLVVRAGTVHGLIGQNGAGKSTIVNILNGLVQPDSGTIAVGGVAVGVPSPRAIERLGVHIIHQEPLLVPGATVAESLFLGTERRRGPLLRRRSMRRAAGHAIAEHFGLAIDGATPVDALGAAERQVVQITRSLLADARVLVFDEPTASLVRSEAERLFSIIRRLRDAGTAIVYVSHYLEEVRALCDAVTVLREGRDVATLVPAHSTVAAMAALMVDRDLGAMFPPRTARPAPADRGTAPLAVRGLGRAGAFRDVSFSVDRGEILGLTGLVGSGAKELLLALFGLAQPDRGSVVLDGAPTRLRAPADAIRRGIGLIPEDRRRQGVAPDATVTENVTLPSLGRLLRFGLIDRTRERSEADRLIRRLDIKTAGRDASVRSLSGGNQQKVALAKWLGAGARVFLLDEPTIAVDVAAKIEIYRLLAELAEAGAAIVLLSTDLAELEGLADRVLVMHRGRIANEFAGGTANAGSLLAAMAGGGVADDAVAA